MLSWEDIEEFFGGDSRNWHIGKRDEECSYFDFGPRDKDFELKTFSFLSFGRETRKISDPSNLIS